jgi:hypothetical protein
MTQPGLYVGAKSGRFWLALTYALLSDYSHNYTAQLKLLKLDQNIV